MIRGVSKNIIEISDTGNDCFERAILFVRPDSETTDSDHMRKNAVSYLTGLKIRRGLYRSGFALSKVLGWFSGALVGALATALAFLL